MQTLSPQLAIDTDLTPKDNYWSTEYQAGNPYGASRFEPYSRLQAAVSTLSTGPVAPSDGLGFSDPALILRSCMSDGALLQVWHGVDAESAAH